MRPQSICITLEALLFPDAPRTLVVLLATVVLLRLGFALLEGSLISFSLLQVGFLAFFSWQALRGRESAAKVLAALLLLGAALDSYAIVRLMAQRGYFVAAFLLIPAFHITVAAYIFFSKDARTFFEKRAFVSPYAP